MRSFERTEMLHIYIPNRQKRNVAQKDFEFHRLINRPFVSHSICLSINPYIMIIIIIIYVQNKGVLFPFFTYNSEITMQNANSNFLIYIQISLAKKFSCSSFLTKKSSLSIFGKEIGIEHKNDFDVQTQFLEKT